MAQTHKKVAAVLAAAATIGIAASAVVVDQHDGTALPTANPAVHQVSALRGVPTAVASVASKAWQAEYMLDSFKLCIKISIQTAEYMLDVLPKSGDVAA